MSSERILGLILVGLGAVLLLILTTDIGPEAIVAFIGLSFLIAYGVTRSYGFLVPGGILTGLGTGIVLSALNWPGNLVVIGLGAGFLLIAIVDLTVGARSEGWWWPLIPGGILSVVGVATSTRVNFGAYALPVLLIGIGVLLLLTKSRET